MNQYQEELFFGRLGKDPVMKTTKNGKGLCLFSVCVEDEKTNVPRWFQFVAWEQLAQSIVSKFKKGDAVFIKGQRRDREILSPNKELKIFQEYLVRSIGPALSS